MIGKYRGHCWAGLCTFALTSGVLLVLMGCFPPFTPNEPNTPNTPNTPNEPNAPNEPNTPNEPNNGNSGVTGQYVGSIRCLQCHQQKHDTWALTNHAKALETLEAIGQGKNANCLPCHTVGFGEAGGYVDRATTNILAGVGCEDCHGPARAHVNNVGDASLRPKIDIAAGVCGRCHTDVHHPTFDEWSESGHSKLVEELAEEFTSSDPNQYSALGRCGTCHSGDFRYLMNIAGSSVRNNILFGLPGFDPNTLLVGKDPNKLNAQTCAICHDPHQQTGNSTAGDPGEDFQLRYPDVTYPTPDNSIAGTQDPNRFNICGQCHHERGRVWTATSRGPHHSDQVNMYVGEMAMPAGQEGSPLVPNQRSLHAFVPGQCTGCHMVAKEFESEELPADSGHKFSPTNYEGCSAVGCHPTPEDAQVSKANFQALIQSEIDDLKARLGPISEWGYTSDGGPGSAGQAALPAEIKKVRFMIAYTEVDGSMGVHNPMYVRSMLDECDKLLTSIGK
jgi:hypothetical protein